MEPLQIHRRHRDRTGRRAAVSPKEGPGYLHASIATVGGGRQTVLPVNGAVALQRLIGNRAVSRMLAGPAASVAPLVVQRFNVDEMKQSLGDELLEKHVGTEPMPDVSSSDGREEAVAAVYYQRAKDDRRSMNTVFFVNPATLFADLKETNRATDLKSGPNYTTTSSYPAITVLVVGTTNKDSEGNKVTGAVTGPFKKLEIQSGEAKPMVRINKETGLWAFNHLQETSPKTLGTKVDLLKSED
jgi:hypothetical protein